MDGIINVYKEAGFTSHDVVAKLRGICRQKKIGHTGTLDPQATGVLPVCLGNATRACEMLTDRTKEYVAELLLGQITDTQDITGTVLEEREVAVSEAQVREVIAGFVGGGVARGLCVGILVTAISLFFVPFQVHSWVFVALTLMLTAVLFSLAGLLNAVFAKTFDDISLIPTFVLTPLTYLGGVFYSLTLLPPFWQGLSHLNPIVYMISGFRFGFLGINDVPLATTFAVLVVFIVAFYLLCWSLIQRGRGLRS